MNIISRIDNFLSKAEKIYFQPEKGEKPPKGAQVKVGPREGTFYEGKENSKLALENNAKEVVSRILKNKPQLLREDISNGSCASFLVLLRKRLGQGKPMFNSKEDHFQLKVGNYLIDSNKISFASKNNLKKLYQMEWNEVFNYIKYSDDMPLISVTKKSLTEKYSDLLHEDLKMKKYS